MTESDDGAEAEAAAPGEHEILRSILSMSTRQVRLLEEIRDLLAPARNPPRRRQRNHLRAGADYD